MKNRLFEKLAAVLCALCLAVGVMSGVVFARDDNSVQEPEETIVVLATNSPEAVDISSITSDHRSIPLLIDDVPLGECPIISGIPYVKASDFCKALGLDVRNMYSGGVYSLLSDSFRLDAELNQVYFTFNDRCLYVEYGVSAMDGQPLLPVAELSKCLGVSAVIDKAQWILRVDGEELSLLESGESFYDATDLYWLSHVINAETDDQASMTGKVAVGSVVLNRLGNDQFPNQNSVYDVIFAKNQFDVVINGMIYMEPSESAKVAAKIALEGYDAADGATYFGKRDLGEGYKCVMWIDDHCFMTHA